MTQSTPPSGSEQATAASDHEYKHFSCAEVDLLYQTFIRQYGLAAAFERWCEGREIGQEIERSNQIAVELARKGLNSQ